MALKLPDVMEKFFKEHVEFDEKLMKHNKAIVEDFMFNYLKGVIENSLKDLPLSVGGVERQGLYHPSVQCFQTFVH